ncbi:hypothetical protein BAUCODRAFT_30288, partial [Baudoinia panamericana UAMH 10762]
MPLRPRHVGLAAHSSNEDTGPSVKTGADLVKKYGVPPGVLAAAFRELTERGHPLTQDELDAVARKAREEREAREAETAKEEAVANGV